MGNNGSYHCHIKKRSEKNMKKLITFVAMLFVLSSMAFAATDDLTPTDLDMGPTDVVVVEYCVYGISPADAEVGIVVDPVCRDVNGVSGCQAADTANPAEFTAVPAANSITVSGGTGCVDITLTTADADGVFYYTVNGQQEGTVTSETGSAAIIPEFGVLASAAVLGIAGFYIARKRK